MGWLLRHNWLWALLAFMLGAVITWFLLVRRGPAQAVAEQQTREAAEEKSEVLVGAGVAAAGTAAAAPTRHFEEPAEQLREEPVEAFDQTQHEAPPAADAGPVTEVDREETRAADPVPLPMPEPVENEPAQPNPTTAVQAKAVAAPVFSRRMDAEPTNAEPTLFDEPVADEVPAETDAVPPGRYGVGSAEAVPHQGPPDGFTIKGNVQSKLFHTPDSPYYGRTRAEVWFRTEADAERAGFTKYVRKPRKSASPGK